MFENWTYISVLQFLNLYIKDNKTFRKSALFLKKCSFFFVLFSVLIAPTKPNSHINNSSLSVFSMC